MLQIDNTIISFDLFEKKFICNLAQCKGECCVAGDSGAPISNDELLLIEDAVEEIWDELSEKAKEVIDAQGVAYVDDDGDLVTSIIGKNECVFTLFDKDGITKCAFEKAYEEGRIDFLKPISCHLYPIRLTPIGENVGVNYDQWPICDAARVLGIEKGVAVFEFLKTPLIRRFGEDWYRKLELAAGELRGSV